MPIVELTDIPALVSDGGTLLGLDLGTKTIGVSASDREWRFAHPRPVIARKKFRDDLAKLTALIEADRAEGLVLGLPLHLDGGMSPRAQAAKAFARNVLRERDLPISFWDERMSTLAAERALLEMDVSRRNRAGRIDSAAAAFILQGALDRLASLGTKGS